MTVMLTAADLAALSMFAPEGEAVLKALLRDAGDISLGAGESLVHEGDEPAL
jgi:hypothetical protein